MRVRRFLSLFFLLCLMAAGLGAQKPATGGPKSIEPSELKEWLSYIASDDLQGRQIYTEGLGLAAGYITQHLAEWGVKPAGENGSYFQTVKVVGVRTNSNASVTVDVNGQKRTFKDGEGITFPRNMGGKQTITGDQIQFVGYGLQIPAANIDDYANLDPKGKVLVFIGSGSKSLPTGSARLLAARSRNALEKGAIAVIGPPGFFGFGRGGRGATGAQGAQGAASAQGAPSATGAQGAQPARGAQPTTGRGAQPDNGDFTTVQRYDTPVAPALTAQDEFLEFLFSGSDVKYSELKELSTKQEPIAPFALKGVKITINVDADYTVVRTQLTHNVVGIIPGTDPTLKDTYVAFGAHYDHVGYSQTSSAGRGFGGGAAGAGGCTGQTRETPRPGDNIYNGADDDGSGTVALIGLAKAFALGPKPKRSLLFVWHSGEESGLYGSRYNADFPIVPIDKIAAQLNIDMIGRNRCDDPNEENKVYIVGSDRISSELHNSNEDANASLPKPMALDYEFNDPTDPESLYTRSDHYSYAAKGIPIIFYTTGLHKDYHYVTDEVSKIDFPKMAHITQLVYATGMKVANLDHVPARDNKGPRKGKGATGRIDTK
ncbi:MAG TPA: M28 family peptidase [Vicinamibacterales bacterium]|nr:M28 family peptidase [Vicinamibacterales bacterium]